LAKTRSQRTTSVFILQNPQVKVVGVCTSTGLAAKVRGGCVESADRASAQAANVVVCAKLTGVVDVVVVVGSDVYSRSPLSSARLTA